MPWSREWHSSPLMVIISALVRSWIKSALRIWRRDYFREANTLGGGSSRASPVSSLSQSRGFRKEVRAALSKAWVRAWWALLSSPWLGWWIWSPTLPRAFAIRQNSCRKEALSFACGCRASGRRVRRLGRLIAVGRLGLSFSRVFVRRRVGRRLFARLPSRHEPAKANSCAIMLHGKMPFWDPLSCLSRTAVSLCVCSCLLCKDTCFRRSR
mmetsp:Transcript_51818/g.83623  ORF Transcript_51818/g.83623 Transcript_51818/m.83623 type:complete len:211 (+) Transcript_51818:782-1414(+)